MSIGMGKLISGELIIGDIIYDSENDIIRVEECLGLRIAPPQPGGDPQKISIGFYPLNPFSTHPMIEGCFLIFSDNNVPDDIVDQYRQILAKTKNPNQKGME